MSRKHLTQSEVHRMIAATAGSRTATRDACLLALAYRHGLRISEACNLRLHSVDVSTGVIHVARLKKGLSTSQPIAPIDIPLITDWLAERERLAPPIECDSFFISERRQRLDRRSAWVVVQKYGRLAGLPLNAHPHMLRHACGYALADQGADTRLIQDYLGHRSIQHTVRYTATNPERFKKLWR